MTYPTHSPARGLYDDDDNEATIVQASPLSLSLNQTMIGYPLAPIAPIPTPVRHTYTEPTRGYPSGAAYVPTHHAQVDESSSSNGYVIETFAAHPMNQAHVQQEPQQLMHEQVAYEAPQRHWTTPSCEVPATSFEAPAYPHTHTASEHAASPAASVTPAVTGWEHPHYGESFAGHGHVTHVVYAAEPDVSRPTMPSTDPTVPSETPEAGAPPATFAAAPTTDKPKSSGRAMMGALLGALAGAALWGAIGFVTGGYELKYGAVLIGLLTGGGASLFGRGASKGFGILGGVFGLVGILGGKALFELLVQPALTMAQHIAYHTTPIDFIFYGATIVAGFAVGSGTLAPSTIVRRGRHVLRRFLPTLITG